MKRIAICMDGTWQRLSQPRATNVNLIARSIAHQADGVPQIVIYTPGVGSTLGALQGRESGVSAFNTWLTSTIGGVFGEGLEDAILDTYLRLAFNYEPGDEIYIFGFSRGAFSARSLAALIGKCGVVRRRFAVKADEAFALYRDKDVTADSPEAIDFRLKYGKRLGQGADRHSADFRPQISYLGIFDTVGQRGLPSVFGPLADMRNKSKFGFHDLNLGHHVNAARHALAIDERRRAFPPTLWENFDALNQAARQAGQVDPYQQRWFVGGHGDIGGGNASTLSTFSLDWMVEGAERAGLAFDRTAESPLTLTLAPLSLDPAAPVTVPTFLRSLSPINWTGRWREIAKSDDAIDRARCEASLHPSVGMRTVARLKKPYTPPPLRPFKDSLAEITAGVALVTTLIALVQAPEKRKKFLGIF